jgi:hypothetical protein
MKRRKMKQKIYSIVLLVWMAACSHQQLIAGNLFLPEIDNGTVAYTVVLKAAAVNNTAELSWQHARQMKVRRYELEKSTDGENFTYVTAVPGQAASKISYTVQDRNLLEGMNYYRLKVIDNNGNAAYSKTVSLKAKSKAAEIKIMPGIVTDEVYIWLPANTLVSSAAITDMMGRKILEDAAVTNFTNVASVQLGRLPIGMYKINVLTNTGLTANLKFSKK